MAVSVAEPHGFMPKIDEGRGVACFWEEGGRADVFWRISCALDPLTSATTTLTFRSTRLSPTSRPSPIIAA